MRLTAAEERRILAQIRATTSACRWCGYRLPPGHVECQPRGEHSDSTGSIFCVEARQHFVDAAIEAAQPPRLRLLPVTPAGLVAALRREGLTYREIAAEATCRRLGGRQWTPRTVRSLHDRSR